MAGDKLRVLLIGACSPWPRAVRHELQRLGYTPLFTQVATIASLRARLRGTSSWDVVIAQHANREPSALDALAIMRAQRAGVPVIVVANADQPEILLAARRLDASEHVFAGDARALAAAVQRAVRWVPSVPTEQGAAVGDTNLGQLQHDFVTAVTHELRTPLTSIIGFGELLQVHWSRFGDTERLRHVGRMVRAAQRQQRLVEDVLLLARLDRELPALQPAPVQVANVVAEAVTEAREAYHDQPVRVDGPDEVRTLADHDRVVQILTAIIGNAAKHSPEGGAVDVRWRSERDSVVVRVRDAGPGIPPDAVGHLFTRFGRIPGSSIRAGHVGTGLGLYLGRRLARAMGGELDLERTGPKGSTFRLQLPAAPAAPDCS